MSKELTRLSPEEISAICDETFLYMLLKVKNSSATGEVDLKDMSLVWAGLAHNMLKEFAQMNGVESVDSFYRFMLELFNDAYKFVKEGGGQ